MGFPGGSDSKASAHNAGGPGFDPWVGKIPWRRKWQPTPVLLPRKFHGWRSLVDYSPWGCKELDTTEQLHFLSFFIPTMEYYTPIKTCEVHNKGDESHKSGIKERKPQLTLFMFYNGIFM